MWREENKYSRWYDALINKARQRTDLAKPFERHHVWPISLGGARDSETVRLTFREHFLAHRLLTKFVLGAVNLRRMNYALSQMCWYNGLNSARIVVSSKQCEVARSARLKAIALREPYRHTEEFKRALSLRSRGNKYGKGQKKGYKPSPETITKLKEAGQRAWDEGRFDDRHTSTKGNPGYRHTNETKEIQSVRSKGWWSNVDVEWLAARGKKISEKLQGRQYTEETLLKMSAAAKQRWGVLSEKERQELSSKHTGWTQSNETRTRISESIKKLWSSEDHQRKMSAVHTGRKHSEETLAKMRTAQQGRRHKERIT